MGYDSVIESLYEKLGVIKNCDARPLHTFCEHHELCWLGHEDRKATGEKGDKVEWSYISAPWIGENYEKIKIAVIGINPNEAGGLNKYRKDMIPEVRKNLLAGKIKINFNYPGYKGTLLFHRIGAYVGEIILASENQIPSSDRPSEPIPLHEAYGFIAFLNQVKCSPVGELSKPTATMWDKCGKHILLKELQVLDPRILLVLGNSDNQHYLIENVLENSGKHVVPVATSGRVCSYVAKIVNRNIGIVVVPHPSSWKGASKKIRSDVFKVVSESRERWLQGGILGHL